MAVKTTVNAASVKSSPGITLPSLKDKVFAVTGGSRGIGKSLVEALLEQEAKVIFTYINSQDVSDALMREYNGKSMRLLAVRADCRSAGDAKDMINEAIEEFGQLDGLVNSAGITRDKALMMMTPEEWQEVINTNLTGVFNSCRAAIVTFMKQKYGRILNLSSVAGLMGMAGQTNYSASKAGIIGLTRSLAKEVAPYGVTVNAVAPGYIDTDMTANLKPGFKEKVLEQIPLGRFGSPREVSQLMLFLLSDEAAYITGQTFVADGGLSLG